mgnify:CR=1 FL=1
MRQWNLTVTESVTPASDGHAPLYFAAAKTALGATLLLTSAASAEEARGLLAHAMAQTFRAEPIDTPPEPGPDDTMWDAMHGKTE